MAFEGRLASKGDAAGARIARGQAIASYRQLADRYAAQIDLGEVLYYLAYELEQAGDLDRALAVYRELVAKAPDSKHVANAHIAFGEAAFAAAMNDPKAWATAEAEYRAAIAKPDSPVRAYALYKLAYCHWNNGQYPEALDAFKQAIGHAADHPGDANAANVARSARKDIIPVYAASGRPDRAFDFFASLDSSGDRDKALTMLAELARNLSDVGKTEDELTALRDLARRDDKKRFCDAVQREVDPIAAAPGPPQKLAREVAAENKRRCGP